MCNLLSELKFHVMILTVLAVVWTAAAFNREPPRSFPAIDPALAKAALAAAADEACDDPPDAWSPALADSSRQP